jgi:hypothetical protein
MLVDNIEKRLNVPREIFKDPEQFLLNKYYNQKPPRGFRIELLAARKYNLICNKLKQFKPAHSFAKHSQKTFCPYCEKTVIPKRLHKLDPGDIVLLLLTAGLWLVFLLVMYLFIRRCPVCNYNLRGFKSLSKK